MVNGKLSDGAFCEYGFMVTEVILRGDTKKRKKYI
jgi:hypothetical protein